MKTHKMMQGVLLLSTGFLGGWWCATPRLAAALQAPAVDAAHEEATPRLLERCEARLRLLRQREFEIEQEQQHLQIEQRIGERSPFSPDQAQRLRDEATKGKAEAVATQREIRELLDLADKLRSMMVVAPSVPPPPQEWLREARTRLRMRAIDESR